MSKQISKGKKKLLTALGAVLVIVCVCTAADIRNNINYNRHVEETKARYLCLHDDLEKLIKGDKPAFQNLDYEWAFFFTSYIEWEKLFDERDRLGRLPEAVYRDVDHLGHGPVEPFRKIRDIYYDCVEQAYFEGGKLDRNMMDRLEEADNLFQGYLAEADLL